jgi:hypothetical protein
MPTDETGELQRLDTNAFLAVSEQRRLITDAEAAAAGIRTLTVVHGDLETHDDAERFEALHRAFHEHAGDVGRTQGGNDYTTFVVGPPGAEQAIAALTDVAQRLNPGWWEITPTIH